MNRRSLLQRIALGAGALSTAATGTAETPAGPVDRSTYRNPVFEPVFADPSTVRTDDGWYYAYGTMDRWGDGEGFRIVPIVRSTNLVDWEYVGDVFESVPEWLERGDADFVWAPDVAQYRGKYHLYYSLVDAAPEYNDDAQGVGLAVADSPAGPFTDRGKVLQGFEVGVLNSIDPMFYVDDGTPHLIWGSFNGIYLVELTPDGTAPAGDPVQIASARFEGPYVEERDGTYYLFVSSGTCCDGPSSSYRVEVGRADSLDGPYLNRDGESLLDAPGSVVVDDSEQFGAPGHNGLAYDDADRAWLVYHGYERDEPGFIADGAAPRRPLFVDPLQWESGWPAVEGRVPSVTQRRPSIETGEQPRVAVPNVSASVTSVTPDERFSVTATIRNEGADGTAYVNLYDGSTVVDSAPAVLSAGETQEVSFETRLYTGGDHALSVGTSVDRASEPVTVTVDPRPAELAFDDVEMPDVLSAAEAGEFSATVRNVGSYEASESVDLVVDGSAVMSSPVDLDPGESTALTFRRAFTVADDGYQVDLVAGNVEERLGESDDDFYGRQDRLIQYAHTDGDEVTDRDTWINSLAPETRAHVDADPVEVGDGTASVDVTVTGETDRPLSLAGYTLPGGEFSFDTADEQDLVAATSRTLDPGEHTLEIPLPGEGSLSTPESYGTHEVTFDGDDSTAATLTVLAPPPASFSTFANTTADFGQLDGDYAVNAAGTDTWTFADEYGTLYRSDAAGERVDVEVRVTGQEETDAYAKAGIMVRNDLAAPGESLGYVLLTALAGTGYQLSWDATDDGFIDSGPVAGSEPDYPVRLRLEKRGSTFRGYYSPDDGATWAQVGSAVSVPSADAVQDAGMFVCALDADPSLVTFDEFAIRPR
ncbi:family 43 glycosylhydrolase [Candidatus Halobonum tyrrellensis]|nr:family 43 glycosylhydrolase [Candidatus Halobonum tyrrellensis]